MMNLQEQKEENELQLMDKQSQDANKDKNIQNLDLDLLGVQGVINRKHLDECSEEGHKVPEGSVRSSVDILKSSDAELIAYDLSIFKSIDVDKQKPMLKNINKAKGSVGYMPLVINENSIADIDSNLDIAFLKNNNFELEAHAPKGYPLHEVSTDGLQIKEIIENFGNKYQPAVIKKRPSEIMFPNWSNKVVCKMMEGDNDIEGVEEEELHTKETSLVACNSPSMLYAGSTLPALEHMPYMVQYSLSNCSSVPWSSLSPMGQNNELNAANKTRQKLQELRVKFLRLAHRLGHTPHNFMVRQVLYRLGLAEHLCGSRNSSSIGAFRYDRAISIAEQQEASGQEDLDFACTIMVLGKTGVGKSATINSIFDEKKSQTNAIGVGTKRVQEIEGTINGVRLRVIDTPGLHVSLEDQFQNRKILASVKSFIKKRPPDIVLYIDRLDMLSRDNGDLPLLHTITDFFRPAIWLNAIVVLTHAASAPPDCPYGTPISYEMFVSQRSRMVQQAICQAAGDTRIMNSVSLVENYSKCGTNRADRVIPSRQIWKTEFLVMCFASQILAEANSFLKVQDDLYEKPLGTRLKVPPLSSILSLILQKRTQLNMPEQQLRDWNIMDDDSEDLSDVEEESEYEYDKLPPFKRLTRSQLAKLDKEQKVVYFDELDFREKLFMKKQWKEHRQSQRCMEMTFKVGVNEGNDMKEEDDSTESVPMLMRDMALPPSFDADNPVYRYRFLDTVSQWLVQPILENNGWDHDVGYEGLYLEKNTVIGSNIPVSVSGQVIKDKEEAHLKLECSASLKHGEGKKTWARLDIQTTGKDVSYTLRSEMKFNNFKSNKTTAGLAFTQSGNSLSSGMKLEDTLMIGKRFKVVLNGAAMLNGRDISYGGSLEAMLKDNDYPVGRSVATLGLSLMNGHGDHTVGLNLQSQFNIGRNTTISTCGNLSSTGKGQVSIRINSLEQLQIALVGVIPIAKALFSRKLLTYSHNIQ